MRFRILGLLLGLIATPVWAGGNEVPWPMAAGGDGELLPWPWAVSVSQTLVPQIDSASIQLVEGTVPSLVISAVGITPTGGWSNPQLAPRYTIVPPADGIWDIDFLITPPAPGTIVTRAFVKHSTGFLWPHVPADLRGIRIHGVQNFVEALLDGAPAIDGSGLKIAKPSTPADAVLEIEVKRPIYLNEMPGTGQEPSWLEAKLRLSNPTASPIALSAPTPCDVVNWTISGRGLPIQTEPPEICARVYVYATLNPGEVIETPLNIILTPGAYATDDYNLAVSYWGIAGNAAIHIEVVH